MDDNPAIPSDSNHFDQIDAFVLWLVQRLEVEISEEHIVFLCDRFLKGSQIMMLSDKGLVIVVNGPVWDWNKLLDKNV